MVDSRISAKERLLKTFQLKGAGIGLLEMYLQIIHETISTSEEYLPNVFLWHID